MRIAYLGDDKSHTCAAAHRLFEQGEFVGFKTVEEAVSAVNAKECGYAVLPVENSVEGGVNATMDALTDCGLFICGEITLPIHQNLIVKKGARLSDIKTVYSHPQALSQCREWLSKNLPHAERKEVYFTSYALRLIKDCTIAAIAAQADEGQQTLESGIEDRKNNSTRFIALSRLPCISGRKASVVFDAKNEPGGLLRVLGVFKDYGVNMTSIVSRPSKAAMGDYIFFVDFTFEGESAEMDELTSALKLNTAFVRFLGRYDSLNKLEA